MIHVDIVLAIAIFLSISLGVVFLLWVFYNFRGGRGTAVGDNIEQVQQCPYCAYVFTCTRQAGVFKCPRCRSYIDEKYP